MKKTTVKKNSAEPGFKSGIIALVGRSNSGKSTLINSLIGTKISAVTHLPQTTRALIHGVLNYPFGQAVFVDTPGIFKKRSPLGGKLTERATESVKGVDMIIYVTDPCRELGQEERATLSLIRRLTVPKILVINKSDIPTKEKQYLDDYKNLASEFNAVFELSALYNRHVEPLRDKVLELLPVGEPIYPPGQLTNIDPKFWIAEIIREKIFLALRKEVPYSTHVEVENVEKKPDIMVINAIIYTSAGKYKKMIIGARGRALKEIGIAARKELSGALNKKIFLALEVETDKHWGERA